VQNVRITDSTSSSITIAWDEVPGATIYKLYQAMPDPTLPPTLVYSGPNLSFQVSMDAGYNGSEFPYTVVALDDAGHESVMSFERLAVAAAPNNYFETFTSYLIATDETVWAFFRAAAGLQYTILCNDASDGDATQTADIVLDGYQSDLTTSYFGGQDNCYSAGVTITAAEDGMVFIRATEKTNAAGSFELEIAMPPISLDGNTGAGVWQAFYLEYGNILWFSLTTQAGLDYTVSWQDSNDQAGTDLTSQIVVSAFDADRQTILDRIDGGPWPFDTQSYGYTYPAITTAQSTTTYFRIQEPTTGLGYGMFLFQVAP